MTSANGLPPTVQRRILRLVGLDVTRCPACGQGRMIAQPLPVDT
jgi:hypothetical protein